MRKKNGFTLIELLAVIVVLAIIMVIAIPAVLSIMNNARKSSFAIYIEKVVKDVQTQYVSDSNFGQVKGSGVVVYNIQSDLGYTTTGNYVGYVVVNATDVDNVQYTVFLHDNNYMIIGDNITVSGMPTKDSTLITAYDSSSWTTKAANEKYACTTATGSESTICQNRYGQIIQTA